ncbi:hypothetical protein DL762_008307 [Monosporascus cannonballus]|uniref:PHD-type domain-containing protein n=1 Tax=Monosporascus cannonballus TaxID=155416 RepID=A0ABY0GWI4_9PEZI|nr:hypothetical protein DL762_008307 [Monosporascus cannonballus]
MMDGMEGLGDNVDLGEGIDKTEASMVMEAPRGGSDDLFDPFDPSAFADLEAASGRVLNGEHEEENIENHKKTPGDVNGDVKQLESVEPQMTTESSSRPPKSSESRLFPIEVVLTPPADPGAYEILSPSFVVDRVLEEVHIGGQAWYSVEYSDGRIEQVAYDDLLEQERGPQQVQSFWEDPRFPFSKTPSMGRPSKKRSLPEDAYSEEYESDDSPPRRKPSPLGVRRSQRAASRQASADLQASTSMMSFGGLDDDDDDDRSRRSRSRKLRSSLNTTRQTRSRTQPPQRYKADDSSADELSRPRPDDDDDDDDGTFKPVISDVKPHLKSSARKRRKPAPSFTSRKNDRESSIEFEPTRRSGRSNKASRSMRDPELDDDYEVIDEKAMTAPKVASIKETFQQLPSDSEFRKFHSSTCDTCGGHANSGKDPLIYCQGCSNSYHRGCIGVRAQRDHRVTKVAADEFVLQCRYCIDHYRKKDARAPGYARCQVCKDDGSSCAEFSPKKTPKQEEKIRLENGGEDPITNVDPALVNNADNVLFRCSTCRRAYHFDHLPPLAKTPVITEDIKRDRLEEYTVADWKCRDCVNAGHKIRALVAWRPINQDDYQHGQTCLDLIEDSIEYLVNWEGRSHFHDNWMPGAWVFGVAHSAMRISFYKREENQLPKMDEKLAIQEEWLLADVLFEVAYRRRFKEQSRDEDVERIGDVTSVLVKFQGLGYDEVVWDEPPPRNGPWGEEPWNAFRAAYEEYVNGKYFQTIPDHKMKERISQYRGLDFSKECELKQQPSSLKRGKLMEYQMEGVNWLLYNFHQQQNVILADEMGLGKTVQIVAFITALVHDKPNCWPFLIVVPNSTCPNWRRELKQWAPDLRVVAYHGGKQAQDLAYRHELFPNGPGGGMKAHVVIMSYEAATTVTTAFQTVKWTGLIVDEGQRLKNEGSLLYQALRDMKIRCRILLTGTPLQNNKRELFNLLQFVDPANNAQELDTKYAELTKENLPELHDLIRPYFLRRTKAQVLKFLPPMAQIILPVTMTILQERLCRGIMSRNSELIKTILSKGKMKVGKRGGLINILSELRQCLCHPFCFDPRVEDKTVSEGDMHRNLVSASGKLMLLSIMLPKLQERGHRVLIFSQFLRNLDILEDFLTGIGIQHARIDGQMSALKKQKRIDAFNAPDSPLSVMLLSTRAGGVGINLATADTVIIYDPDFNPHQDIQALSRAHRIGQKNKVLCFQLTTKNSVEEKIMQIGRKKMALDHALIESMDAADDAGEDLESLLKHAAEALFGNNESEKITYDAAAVDKLLDRSQIESTSAGDEQSAENQFSFARVWANNELVENDDSPRDDSEPADTSVWEKILRQREEEHQREIEAQKQEYGRGARRKGTQGIDYNGRVGFIEGVDDLSEDERVLTKVQQPQEPDSAGSDVEMDELYIDNNEPDEEYESDGFQDPATVARSRQKGTKGTKRPLTEPSTPNRSKRAKTVNTPSSNRKRPSPRGVRPRGEQSSDTQSSDAQSVVARLSNQQHSHEQHPHEQPGHGQSSHEQSSHPQLSRGQSSREQTPEDTVPAAPAIVGPSSKATVATAPGIVGQAQTVGTQTGQTRAPPPDVDVLPYSLNILPRQRMAPNSVVSILRHLAPQQVGSQHTTSSRTQPNMMPQAVSGNANSGGNSCLICKKNHPTNGSCVNTNSEISLRIALDSLRTTTGDEAAIRTTRETLAARLRELTSGNT